MRHVSLVSCAAAAIIALAPTVARADAQVEAEALFRQGKELVKAGKLADGCAKLAASERLESSTGTLLNLGDCREHLGQRASAWAAFRKAEATARHAGNDEARAAEAKRRAEALEPNLPTLTVTVLARVPGETVHQESPTAATTAGTQTGPVAVDNAAWGTSLPVDAGTYTVTAEAPGFLPWKTTIAIEPTGARRRGAITIPPLTRASTAVSSLPADEPRAMAMRDPGPRVTTVERAHTWSRTRGLSVALAVLGAGAIGTGAYFGIHSGDLSDKADARCPLVVCTDRQAIDWSHDARTDARVADALYIGGGAAIATAGILWFVGRPADELVLVPTAGVDHVGVAVRGSL